jgi:tetratricopeptide (TPR) repeat protein
MTRPLTILVLTLVLVGFGSPVQAHSHAPVLTDTAAVDSLLLEGKRLLQAGMNTGSKDSLRQARALFLQATGGSTHRALAHYYVGLADYRLNNQVSDEAEEKREQILGHATDHLKQATTLDEDMADAWALLTGVYGQRMGLNPMQGMLLGSDAGSAIERAKKLDPDNPRVWIIDGTQDFFTPSLFGGDKERALRKFKKAAQLAQQESIDDPLRPSWGHAESYAWIGIAHMQAERSEKARDAFQNALDVNPDYGWVKSVLLPELEEQNS